MDFPTTDVWDTEPKQTRYRISSGQLQFCQPVRAMARTTNTDCSVTKVSMHRLAERKAADDISQNDLRIYDQTIKHGTNKFDNKKNFRADIIWQCDEMVRDLVQLQLYIYPVLWQ